MKPEKLILRCTLSPGDVVTLTAAVRDLHAAYPGEYLTDVRTPCPALWEHNPHIAKIADDDPEARVIEMQYPLIHQSNQRPFHFLHGYRIFLEEQLGRPIAAGAFRGDIHLSAEEKGWTPQVEGPFWIIVSGGKSDFTAKLWDPVRWQEVVDHFAGRIRFVQAGERGHDHPVLRGVVNLLGQTNLRQLVRLVHHAEGIACGVTSLMHLAAAVPTKTRKLRPCVVVAGGREPAHWEAYPGHRFLENVGSLACCANGGCWKSRVVARGDDQKHDKSLCERPVEVRHGVAIPKCLEMISSADVIRAIESYLVQSEPEKLAPAKGCCGPGKAKMVVNIVRAAGRAVEAALTGKPVLLPYHAQMARIRICRECPRYSPPGSLGGSRCHECGCFVKAKAGLATERCPLGKWPGEVLIESPPARKHKIGVVIGTFGAVPYIHLQLEARRRFHPEVPYLVIDDASKHQTELEALCTQYGAEFESNPKRLGHVPGDLNVFIRGHEWAKQRGIELLVKFSRRWIPVKPWVDDLLELHSRVQSPTYSARCIFHRFGFRSECVAMSVAEWTSSTALDHVRKGMGDFAKAYQLGEAVIHHAGALAFEKRGGMTRIHERSNPHHPQCGGYISWPMMTDSRRHRVPGVLWHEYSNPDEYLTQLNAWEICSYRSMGGLACGILVRRHGALGDVVNITTILRQLKLDNPESLIHVATDCREALEGNCDIDAVFGSHIENLSESYARVIDLNNAYEKRPEIHMVDAYSMEAFGHTRIEKSLLVFKGDNLAIPTGAVAMHCGSTWASRTMPPALWQEVSDALTMAGFRVLALGTSKDFAPSGAVDLRGKTSIPQAARIISEAALFIGNDSSLLHVAGSTDTPIVGVFTCVRGDLRMPHRRGSIHWRSTIVAPNLDCYGCLATFTPPVNSLPACKRGDFACVSQIEAKAILKPAFEFLRPATVEPLATSQ